MTLRNQIRKMKEEQKDGIISPIFDKYLYRRPPDDRGDDWHISEVCMMCARAKVLAGPSVATVGPSVIMERIYDVGKGIHHIYQNWYAGNAGVLWGKWECQRCSTSIWGVLSQEDFEVDRCPHDGLPHAWKFKEIPIVVSAKERLRGYSWALEGAMSGIEYKGIIGHSDGLVYSEKEKKWICWDIKSCKNEIYQYQLASGALEKHQKQVNMYAYLISSGYVQCPEELRVPKVATSCVFYVNKNTSEEKEFEYKINKKWVSVAFNEVAKYDRYCTIDIMPTKHPDCAIKGSDREKKCPWKTQCRYMG